MILKISLQPLSSFFFGGESNFNESNEDKGRRSTYVLHSRLFPQQTAALGLLRNQLLLQSGLLADNTSTVTDRAKAQVLIGDKGFRLGSSANGFGVIRRVSPVFLQAKDGELCPPAPLDDVLMPDQPPPGNMLPMHFTNEEGNGSVSLGRLTGYKEKTGVSTQFQHSKCGNISVSDFLIKDKRVGITKSARPWAGSIQRSETTAGYYYQTFHKFKSAGISPDKATTITGFCYYVEIDESVIGPNNIKYNWSDTPLSANQQDHFTLQSAVVEFGGERSTFSMKVEKLEDANDWALPQVKYYHTKVSNDTSVNRLVCLSPAFIAAPEALRNITNLRITRALPFRFLKSVVSQTSAYQSIHRIGDHKKQQTGLHESKLFQLLDRGSTFYFPASKRNAVEQLFNNKEFKTIGYNQYQII